jgi:hypothetical protein
MCTSFIYLALRSGCQPFASRRYHWPCCVQQRGPIRLFYVPELYVCLTVTQGQWSHFSFVTSHLPLLLKRTILVRYY